MHNFLWEYETIEGYNKWFGSELMMSKSSIIAQILAYVAENKIITIWEVESQEMMIVKSTSFEVVQIKEIGQNCQEHNPKKSQAQLYIQ